jgi:hypothetical protein
MINGSIEITKIFVIFGTFAAKAYENASIYLFHVLPSVCKTESLNRFHGD